MRMQLTASNIKFAITDDNGDELFSYAAQSYDVSLDPERLAEVMQHIQKVAFDALEKLYADDPGEPLDSDDLGNVGAGGTD